MTPNSSPMAPNRTGILELLFKDSFSRASHFIKFQPWLRSIESQPWHVYTSSHCLFCSVFIAFEHASQSSDCTHLYAHNSLQPQKKGLPGNYNKTGLAMNYNFNVN